jgi:hypothetical protein
MVFERGFWRDALRGDRPPPPSTDAGFSARLPSRHDGIFFGARFDVRVHPGAPPDDRARAARIAAAQGFVRRVAEDATSGYSVADQGGAQHGVSLAVHIQPGLRDHGISYVRVDLAVDPADADRARQREAADADRALAALRHQAVLDEMRELRDDVFRDSGQARLWWLVRHPDQVDRLEQVGKVLDGVVETNRRVAPSAAGGGPVAEVIGLCAELLRDMDPALREHLARYAVHELRQVFKAYERPDLAERLPFSDAPDAG